MLKPFLDLSDIKSLEKTFIARIPAPIKTKKNSTFKFIVINNTNIIQMKIINVTFLESKKKYDFSSLTTKEMNNPRNTNTIHNFKVKKEGIKIN
jgi:hypothetical protein